MLEIINETGSATLIAESKKELDASARDKLRAEIVRKRLEE